MRHWKWKRILLIASVTLVVLAGAGYWAMSFAVDKALRAIAGDAYSIIASMEVSSTPSPSVSPVNPPQTPNPTTSPSRAPNSSPDIQEPTEPGATPSTRESNQTTKPTATPYVGAIDTEKAEQAQENISVGEKLQVTSIFMKRFSTSELNALMGLTSGGLNVEEKIEAKKVVLKKLSEDEYDQLITIAVKLGLSQGKSYAESLNEFNWD